MPASKPHIVMIHSDQHNPLFLGCGDDPHQATPALDRLASEGALFENACCGSPLCVPSRMSMLTGRHCHEIDVWGNDDSLSSDIPTIAHSLGIAGYRTVLCGRMHFIGGDQNHGFQERVGFDVCSGFPGVNRSEDRFRGYYGVEESVHTAGPGRTVDQEYDTAITSLACRVIRDHEVSGDPRPLFLLVGYYAPHEPFRAYDRFYAMYRGTGDEPVDPQGEALGGFDRRLREGQFASVTPEEIRLAREAYRAKVHFVDEQAGIVMQCLEESPLNENAVTIYSSDHGEMAGVHGLWAKSTMYEGALRVPLIVRAPGAVASGRRIAQPVGHVDLAATLIDIAGGPPLPGMRGVSLWPTLTGEEGELPEAVFAELGVPERGGPVRTVRRGSWKLILYREHPAQLFNLEDDPGELTDRAGDPACAEIESDLERLAHADGWSIDDVTRRLDERKPGIDYIKQWSRVAAPRDPIMWGLPAQF